MAINQIIGNALSGLQASQIGIRTASNNVANVNTPGYARSTVDFAARNVSGQGMGVEVVGVRRVADEFLSAASRRAGSDQSRAEVLARYLDRMQAQFGATDDENSLFGRLNGAMDAISAAAVDPTQVAARASAASSLQSFFDEAARLSAEVRGLRAEVDGQIAARVERVNEILTELDGLNSEIQALTATNADSSGALNRQSELVDELSTYLDISTDVQGDGRIFVRTGNGVGLLDNERIQLSYTAAGSGAYGTRYGAITGTVSSSGATIRLDGDVASGELAGLFALRDEDLPALASGLAEFASKTADALNQAHNEGTAYPPPASLTGRNTGLLGTDVLTGSGEATLAIVDANGELVARADIVFGAGSFTVNGNPGTTIDDLATEITNALGGAGTASFADGRLSITTANPANGISIGQDATAPSSLGGRGFSSFFGLNDLITSSRPAFYETAITGAGALGAAAGGEMVYEIRGVDGRLESQVTVAVPSGPGATVNDLVTALNTGLAPYGTYALDADGQLNFTPASAFSNFDVALVDDTSERGTTGYSVSQIFGVGDAARQSRAEGLDVRSDIRANSQNFAFSMLDISPASVAGDFVLAAGDSRGGQALQGALARPIAFDTAGSLAGGVSTADQYAARFAGDIGARAARAERSVASAQSVKAAADQRRSDLEGVNLDEELANMTLFQQSYNASARLLQAANEMTDTLLSIV